MEKGDNLLDESFTVLIPAYNEERRIGSVLEEICDFIHKRGLNWKVVVSIDGKDGTEGIVSSYSQRFSFITSSRSLSRSGKANALKRALKSVGTEYLITMDADGSMSFQSIIDGLKYLTDFDVVVFSRYSNGNHIPMIRKFMSRGYNLLIRSLLGLKMKDTQSGYIAAVAKPFVSAMNKVGLTNGYYYAVLYYYLKKEQAKIIEIPVKYSHIDGSKFSPLTQVVGGVVSLVAFLLRHSRFYKYLPKKLVSLYYRKFRWI